MKKLPKKLIVLLVSIILTFAMMIAIMFFVAIKITFFSSYIDTIEKNWHINIIGDCKCIYSMSDGILEGYTYYLFEYDESISFDGITIQNGIYGVSNQMVDDILDEMKIQSDLKPKWEEITASATIFGSSHDERNRLYLLINSSEKCFYVIQSIT